MKNLIYNLKKEKFETTNYTKSVFQILDPVFDYYKNLVVEELVVLNSIRKLLRKNSIKDKVKGLEQFNAFQTKRKELLQYQESLKEIIPDSKMISVLHDYLRKSTLRPIETKIPSNPKDYLVIENIEENDIDWILKKTKDYFGKLTQTYFSERIAYLLKSKEKFEEK